MNEFYEFLNNLSNDKLAGIIIAFLIALYIVSMIFISVFESVSKIFVRPKCKCKKEEK